MFTLSYVHVIFLNFLNLFIIGIKSQNKLKIISEFITLNSIFIQIVGS